MATRLKPTRINVDNTPRVGDGAAYQNDNDFHWSMGGGDMAYRDFEWVTLTGNSLVIENISNNVTPTGDFTVSAGTLKPGIEYVLRVNTGNTPYTMTLGTGVTNPNSYKTELKPNTVNQFKFIATSTNQLELEGVDSAVVSEINWGEIGGTLSDQTDLQDALDNKQDKLTAGEGIEIKNGPDYSAMQGPAPRGFHVPLNTEWQTVYDIWTALGGGSSDGANFGIALKLPFAGLRNYSSSGVIGQGTFGNYWSSSRYNANYAYVLLLNSTALNPQSYSSRAYGYSVRCFKDSPTVPTSAWTKLYGTSIEAGGIFWSSADGLISLSSDGQTWVTIADKNLGATQVWNSGDTVTASNCGDYYQWGNNYGFPFDGNVTTSSTQVDASNYGPGNYYSSSTFITYEGRWDTTDNGNLRGGVTGIVTLDNAITNTGVLSVNGQTGNVIINPPDLSNYLAKNNTTAFTPTGDYNPSTKKYVDDQVSAATAGAVSDAAYNETTWDGVTGIAPSKNAVRDKIVTMDSVISGNTSDISTINGKIPSEATTSNQLADKEYVLNNINSVTAYYITKNSQGDQFATYAELAAATTFYSGGVVRVPTRNDYTIVLSDENYDNATTRYIYNSGWEYQYTINETPLTQAQLNALNSGITAAKVTNYDTLNTKTFYLSSTSDLTTAQAAYDWVRAGKMAIIKINTTIEYTTTTGTETVTGDFYFYPRKFHSTPSNEYDFAMAFSPFDDIGTSSVDGDSCQIERILKFTLSGNTVTNVAIASQQFGTFSYLSTRVDYPTPYQPTYAGSPATKKYVDDGLSGKQATLVSGTNIKTVNGNSLLGSGDLTVGGITKIFTLSGTGDLTTAQAAYDWFANGGNPIITMTGSYVNRWMVTYSNTSLLRFSSLTANTDTVSPVILLYFSTIDFTISSGTVTAGALYTRQIRKSTTAPSSGTGDNIITLVI